MSTFYDQIMCFGDRVLGTLCRQGGALAFNTFTREGWMCFLEGLEDTPQAHPTFNTIIPQEIAKDGNKIRLLLLFFGANDATIKGAPQHVPLETYASNLRELLTSPLLTHHNPDIKLLVITPPPICAYRWGDRDREAGRDPQRTAEHTALYAAKAKFVADELKIPYVDLWMGFLVAVGWKPGDPLIGSTKVPKNERLGELLPDGLHFSGAGNQLCFRLVLEKIKQVYPQFDPEKMEVKAPWWDMQQDILAILKERFAN